MRSVGVPVIAIIVASAAWLTPRSASALHKCVVGDKHINLNNGAETAALTGKVVCRDADSGKVVRELPYVKGKLDGVEMMTTFDGSRLETTYRAGKRHGQQRKLDPKGRLLEETSFADDHERGDARTFHPDGKVRTLVKRSERDVETLRFEYDQTGRLADLRCGSTVSMAIGRHPCRYERRSELVRLYHPNGQLRATIPLKDGLRDGVTDSFDPDGHRRTRESFKAGKLTGTTEELGAEGKPVRKVSYRDGEIDGAEEKYFADGKLSERTVWSGGKKQSVLRMWQNGQMRSRLTIKDDGRAELLEEFHDNGKPRSVEPSVRGVDRGGSARMRLDGTVKEWWESGKPSREAQYKQGELDGASTTYFESGAVKYRETWKAGRRASLEEHDEQGKLIKNERYNEDGSRVN